MPWGRGRMGDPTCGRRGPGVAPAPVVARGYRPCPTSDPVPCGFIWGRRRRRQPRQDHGVHWAVGSGAGASRARPMTAGFTLRARAERRLVDRRPSLAGFTLRARAERGRGILARLGGVHSARVSEARPPRPHAQARIASPEEARQILAPSCAWAPARRGVAVTVIETGRPGAGSSGGTVAASRRAGPVLRMDESPRERGAAASARNSLCRHGYSPRTRACRGRRGVAAVAPHQRGRPARRATCCRTRLRQARQG